MPDIASGFDPELRGAIAGGAQAAVIPVGSIEQHGPHLPVSTDSDIVTRVARDVSDRTGLLLLPTVTYGVSHEHAPFFHLSVTGSTMRRMLRDICTSLMDGGIRTVFVINGHHGNQRAVNGMSDVMKKHAGDGIRVFALSYWHFMEEEFDHAGFVETSLMLAVSENVRMESAARGLVTDGMSAGEIRRIGRLAARSFPEATGNGVWGDPTHATAEEGRRILDQVVGNMAERCRECLGVADIRA